VEAQILWSKSIFTLGDLFQEVNLIKTINTTIEVDRFPPSLAIKLKNIIKLIQKDKLVFNSVHTEFTHFQLFLESRVLMPSTILKEKFKEEQDRKFDVAPSYYSRIKENIPVPHNKEIFKECYRFIVKLPTPVHQTSFNFHILNRTLWTTEKAYLSGKNETNKCRKNCDQIATSIHILIDCDSLANPIWSLFQSILRSLEKPVHINFFNIMYFVKIERMSKKRNLEIFQIISQLRYCIYSEYHKDRVFYQNAHFASYILKYINAVMEYRLYKCENSPILIQLKNALINNLE